ncbi:MAG: hypothetical protein ACJA1H_001607 [Glaciecola sp.]|jgi:hypothetical protein
MLGLSNSEIVEVDDKIIVSINSEVYNILKLKKEVADEK